MNTLGCAANYENRLKTLERSEDIPIRWRGTAIEKLIRAHNFDELIEPSSKPELFVATCIEFRFQPKVPPYFAYEVRRASGRLIGSEFTLAFALARGVHFVALIGHNDCGMTQVHHFSDNIVDALVEQGWPRDRAEDYVIQQGARYAIRDELDALQREYTRLRRLFSKVEIAPLFAAIGDGKLYLPAWYDPESVDTICDLCEPDLLFI